MCQEGTISARAQQRRPGTEEDSVNIARGLNGLEDETHPFFPGRKDVFPIETHVLRWAAGDGNEFKR